MIIVELKGSDGKIVGALMAQPKEFKTGGRGFYANGKIEIEGKKYQAQIQLVEIHSKPAAEKDVDAKPAATETS